MTFKNIKEFLSSDEIQAAIKDRAKMCGYNVDHENDISSIEISNENYIRLNGYLYMFNYHQQVGYLNAFIDEIIKVYFSK